MIDAIASKTRNIIYNCIEKWAKQINYPILKTRLALFLLDDQTVGYDLLKEVVEDGKPDIQSHGHLTIMQVLCVRIDILGYSQMAPPFILKALHRFSDSLSIPKDKIRAICYPTADKKVVICIYNDKKYVNQITIHDLISEQDFTMPTT